MKVLLISYYYVPANIIGAVRATKIAKYLEKLGYTVDVVCGDFGIKDEILYDDIKLKTNIHRINGSKILEKFRREKTEVVGKKSINSIRNLHKVLIRSFDKLAKRILGLQKGILFDLLNSLIWYERAKKALSKKDVQYDAIIASFGPPGSLLLGNYCKRRNRAARYIIDIRDPIIPEFASNKILKYFLKKLQLTTFNICDGAVVISNGLKAYLINNSFKKEITVITNGYDLDDLRQINNFDSEKKDELILCYTGALYEGKRDLTKLLMSIRYLISEKLIDEDKIKIYYAGKELALFEGYAKLYSLLPQVSLLTIAHALIGFLGFFINLLAARELGPEKFGIFSIAYATVTYLASFGELGIGATMIRFYNKYQDDKEMQKRVLGASLLFMSFLALTFVLFSPILSNLIVEFLGLGSALKSVFMLSIFSGSFFIL